MNWSTFFLMTYAFALTSLLLLLVRRLFPLQRRYGEQAGPLADREYAMMERIVRLTARLEALEGESAAQASARNPVGVSSPRPAAAFAVGPAPALTIRQPADHAPDPIAEHQTERHLVLHMIRTGLEDGEIAARTRLSLSEIRVLRQMDASRIAEAPPAKKRGRKKIIKEIQKTDD